MNDTITIDMILRAEELMEQQAVPKPAYIVVPTSVMPIPYDNPWLIWLFINEWRVG